MFFKIYVLLPGLLLVMAWFLGSRPWKLAVGFVAIWYGAVIIMMETWGFSNVSLAFLYLFMIVTGPMFAAWVGIRFGEVINPAPVDQVVKAAGVMYDGYESLDPVTKAKIHDVAKVAAKFGCAAATDHFRKQGKTTTARAFRDIGKML